MSETLFFFSPHLLKENLIADDSVEYALVEYDRNVITTASKQIVRFIGQVGLEKLRVDISKKRVKMLMEFLAIALSMDVGDHELMSVARGIYRGWCDDPTVFGSDPKRQNKYLRRMIKQLSLPFEMRKPTSNDVFKTKFAPLLSSILADYSDLFWNKGHMFERETWLTMLNVVTGVTDILLHSNIQRYLPAKETSELKQKAVTCIFTAMELSGISDAEVWNRFSDYCKRWSFSLDYLKVWNKQVNSLFTRLLMRFYQLQDKSETGFYGGVYTEENQVTDQMIAFLFHNFIEAIDISQTSAKSDLLLEIYSSVALMVKTAGLVAQAKSGLFMTKFPAVSFLKIAGRFLTFCTDLPETFDSTVAVNIDTIVSILSSFEPNGAEIPLRKLCVVVAMLLKTKNPVIVKAFLSRANDMYGSNDVILPLMSEISLDLIPSLVECVQGDSEFMRAVSALYVSASQIGSINSANHDNIRKSFDRLIELVLDPSTKFPLYCHAHSFEIPFASDMLALFDKRFMERMLGPQRSFEMIVGCIIYCGHVVMHRPEAHEILKKSDIIPTIVSSITTAEFQTKIENTDLVILSVLQMIYNLIQWTNVFEETKNISALFQLICYLTKRDGKHPKSKAGVSKNKVISASIQHLLGLILARVNLRVPCNDHFSARLDSSGEINEEYVINKLGIKDYVINYYTVGRSLLVSFIEKKDGTGPLVVFARGGFGRTVWVVNPDLSNGRVAQLASDPPITETELPNPTPVTVTPLDLVGEKKDFVPEMSRSGDLDKQDDQIRSKYAKDFSTWLNWDDYAFYYPHNYSPPTQRPRVIDFLATMGMFDVDNKLEVRAQTGNKLIPSVISKLDDLDNVSIIPVSITHILPGDSITRLNTDHNQRMTPLMSTFCKEIGQALKITPEVSKKHKLPEFKTSLPSLVCSEGYVSFISPAMVKSANAFEDVQNIKAPIQIIFNETNFDISLTELPPADADTILLVVKPTLKGFYHVWQVYEIEDIVSPFSTKQTLSVKNLAFNLSLLVDMTAFRRKTSNVIKHRRSAISELCDQAPIMELGPVASGSFTK